jgi:hypothetical protein
MRHALLHGLFDCGLPDPALDRFVSFLYAGGRSATALALSAAAVTTTLILFAVGITAPAIASFRSHYAPPFVLV